MRCIFDNDLHIHSQLSSCSGDPEQTPERILRYAKENGLKKICITDHFWDSKVEGASEWYQKQNFDWISKSRPLPVAKGIDFLFGAETDMDKFGTIGIADDTFDVLDFVIIPTTHLHMRGFTISEEDASTVEGRAKVWISRIDTLLSRDLPFRKIGIAHLTCGLIAPNREDYLKVIKLLPQSKLEEIFKRCAEVGVGIELNMSDMSFADSEADIVLRVYKTAKQQGCRFYFGSDAHHHASFASAGKVFERAIDLLGLQEEDKFVIK